MPSAKDPSFYPVQVALFTGSLMVTFGIFFGTLALGHTRRNKK